MHNKTEDISASLLTNKDFRDWVLNPTEERDLYWRKWMEVKPEHHEAAYKARELILQLRFKEDHLEEDRLEQILANVISDDKPEDTELTTNGSQKPFIWIVAAASVLLVAMLFIWRDQVKPLFTGSSDRVVAVKKVSNPEGQKSRIRLSDGSIVHLNAASTLSFPEHFSDSLRNVELTGEAFFDVVADPERAFIVRSGALETRVTGTTFNVKSYEVDNKVSVALVSGKVMVTGIGRGESEDFMLLPGEKLSYSKTSSTYEKSEFDLSEEIGWKNGMLVFNNTSFTELITLLERWYGVNIIVSNPPSIEWRVNGQFEEESLEEVLLNVQYTYDVEFEITGKKVNLYCK